MASRKTQDNDGQAARSVKGASQRRRRQGRREDYAEADEAFLSLARARVAEAESYWHQIYRDQMDDVSFLHGDQWDPIIKAERERENRPALTFNTLKQYEKQVMGDARQNAPSIHVAPGDTLARGTKFRSETDKTYSAAEVRAGIIRQIEYRSNAREHYKLAEQQAVQGGLAFLRAYTTYVDQTTFVQDIRIERIKKRWQVWIDPTFTEPDASDMNWAFLHNSFISRKEFERRFPGVSPAPMGWLHSDERSTFWYDPENDRVRCTEYYWRERRKVRMVQLANGTVFSEADEGWEEALAAYEKQLAEGEPVAEREAEIVEVFWCKMVYGAIIETKRKIPGTTIPIRPVFGERIEGDVSDDFEGLFRYAKEPAMASNFAISAAIEKIGATPKAPWLVTNTMIEGYEHIWASSNVGNPAYLPYRLDPDNPMVKPERVNANPLIAGEIEMVMLFGERIKGTIGMYDAAVGAPSNETSGRAILARQRESDIGTFVYHDNLAMAVAGIGRVINEWIPVIYGTARTETIRHESGDVDIIELNRVSKTGDLENDIGSGKFELVVKTGPGYTTLREQTAAASLELMQTSPKVADIMADVAVENMDFPGSDRIARRLRKVLPPGLISEDEMDDDDKEKAQTPPEPTPAEQAELAMAEAKMAEAEARKVEAETRIQIAQIDLETKRAAVAQQAQANAQEQAGAERQGQGNAILDAETIRDVVAQAMAELLPAIMDRIGGGATAMPAPIDPAAQPAPIEGDIDNG
jgi:hypothetical protein